MTFLASKKVLWIFVFGGLVLLFTYLILMNRWSSKQDVVKKTEVTTTQVEVSKLPDNFPREIPVESKGDEVDQNYSAAGSEGQSQATRRYYTTKTMEERYKFYTDFFTKNGWTIASQDEQPTFKLIDAKKDSTEILVHISKDPNRGDKVYVDLTSFPIK
jgi:hypothetical protein